jgi:phospholipase/carboxylesterase
VTSPANPHENQPIYEAGQPLRQARAAMILVHGRGASAHDILSLASELRRTELAYLAPQAAGNEWYPNRFIAPVASNEPWLSSALELVGSALARVAEAGIPAKRTLLLGFSQGACLALESAARNPRRYGGLLGLSGALIENGDTSRDYPGSLAGTPVFLGCSDRDFHIPAGRVERSAELLRAQGGEVTMRLYRGLGHTVNADEIEQVQKIVDLVR